MTRRRETRFGRIFARIDRRMPRSPSAVPLHNAPRVSAQDFRSYVAIGGFVPHAEPGQRYPRRQCRLGTFGSGEQPNVTQQNSAKTAQVDAACAQERCGSRPVRSFPASLGAQTPIAPRREPGPRGKEVRDPVVREILITMGSECRDRAHCDDWAASWASASAPWTTTSSPSAGATTSNVPRNAGKT